MSVTFIPGWETTLTLDGADYTVFANSVEVNQARAVLAKPTFGNSSRNSIPGQRNTTFSLAGHLTAEDLQTIQATFEKPETVTFSVQVGTLGAVTDAGTWDGLVTIGEFSSTADAEGEWDFTMSGEFDGEATFTAPTPA